MGSPFFTCPGAVNRVKGGRHLRKRNAAPAFASVATLAGAVTEELRIEAETVQRLVEKTLLRTMLGMQTLHLIAEGATSGSCGKRIHDAERLPRIPRQSDEIHRTGIAHGQRESDHGIAVLRQKKLAKIRLLLLRTSGMRHAAHENGQPRQQDGPSEMRHHAPP